jgi:NADPH:quinone reductase-like Zn-dependent oxidoreductase
MMRIWNVSMFLYSLLFQLTDRNIGNSRDTSFEQLIMMETNGRGVDLVLNSLSEEKLQASVCCLAPQGRFLEIGKSDLANNSLLGMPYYISLLTSFLLASFRCVLWMVSLTPDVISIQTTWREQIQLLSGNRVFWIPCNCGDDKWILTQRSWY